MGVIFVLRVIWGSRIAAWRLAVQDASDAGIAAMTVKLTSPIFHINEGAANEVQGRGRDRRDCHLTGLRTARISRRGNLSNSFERSGKSVIIDPGLLD